MHLLAFPEDLLRLMDRQFGAVARFQLVHHMSEGAVGGLVRRRVLEVLERGVYRVRGGATSPAQAAMAAVLRARPGAVVTGPLVLALLHVEGFTPDLPFEVLVHPGRVPHNVAFPWRRNPTPDETTAWVGGLPVVTPTVALVDSARWLGSLSERQLRVGLDAARWRGLTSTDRVIARSQQLGQRDPGAAFFLELLDAGHAIPESEPERTLGHILRAFDPAPEPQVWVTPRRRVDWYWRSLRLAVEYLGAVDHGGTAQRAGDVAREDELGAMGIRVIPVVAADLARPDDLRAWMRVVLARRARELATTAPSSD